MSDYLLDFFSLCVFVFFLCWVWHLGWSGCAFLAHASCTWVMCLSLAWESWEAWLAGWDFSEQRPFFLPCTCLEPGTLFLGKRPPGTLFLGCHGRRGQPGAFLDVILHLLARGGDGTKAGSTCKIRIVMRANNMVKVGRIILDGVCAERTTRHTWPMPVLCFSRQVNRDMNKRAITYAVPVTNPKE